MHSASKLRLYLLELEPELPADRFAANRKPTLPGYSTDMGKLQKVERFRFPYATSGYVLCAVGTLFLCCINFLNPYKSTSPALRKV